MLEAIINRIDVMIKILETSDIEYKLGEREFLKKIGNLNSIFDINEHNSVSISDLFLGFIIINNKYTDFNDIVNRMSRISHLLDTFDSEALLNLISFYQARKETDIDALCIDYSNKYIIEMIDDNELYKIFVELANLSDIELIYALAFIKKIEKDKYKYIFIECLQDCKKEVVDKEFKKYLKSNYNISLIKENLSKINNMYVYLESENEKKKKEVHKKTNKLKELKNLLEYTENKKEITNVDEIVKLICDEELKNEILKYIYEKNSMYYEELEEKYNKVKKNSVISYIKIFSEKNINFNSYSIIEQKQLMKIDLEIIQKIFSFLEKINFIIKKDVNKIILGTNIEIISNIENYIRKGFLTNNFVKNNINVILSNLLSTDNALYEILINNINTVLNYGINIVGLEDENLKFLISNPKTIIRNLEIIDKYTINIKTRNLRNYGFLTDEDLEEKIIKYNKEGIKIDSHLYLLNSDINVIKRIKICKNIGVDIFDGEKIREEILDSNLFFVPDSKLDDYSDINILKLVNV